MATQPSRVGRRFLTFAWSLSRTADLAFQRVEHLAKLVDHPVVDTLGVNVEQRAREELLTASIVICAIRQGRTSDAVRVMAALNP